jgi:exosortase B
MTEKKNSPHRVWLAWWLLLLGFCAIYLPTLWDLFNGLWRTDQNAHGPMVLAIALWFLVHKGREVLAKQNQDLKPAYGFGWLAMALGLLLYAIGRSQSVYLFELGSIILLLIGTVAIFWGTAAVKRMWFAFFFMLFMIPLPGSVTDVLTQPMKIFVSWGTENLLYWLGYPIVRTGVVLNIGQYQLLVADACAGLNSLFTLEALGLLYMNVVRHSSFIRNVVLASLIVPVSLTSNLLRVILLSLITFYFGDEAGQGFIHGFSGMVLFVTALTLIIFIDGLLRFGIHIGRTKDGCAKTA